MHNLRGIDCAIPLRRITVITGVSGSGKSTLAYDILYAEGQRRFVECLSAYARQFMERLERPDVERIGHLQPPIALRQRVSVKNARSTVGSITELTDYLRLLYVHASEAHCPVCGGSVGRTDPREAIAALSRWPRGTRLALVAPLTEPLREATAERLQRIGYARLLADGRVREIDTYLATRPRGARGRRRPADLGVVVDRIVAGRTRAARLAEGFQEAWSLGTGRCRVHPLDDDVHPPEPLLLREGFACRECGEQLVAPSPALFSANSPLGACPECQGFGRIITVDRQKVVPDGKKNLKNHAVVPFSVPSAKSWYRWLLREARRRTIPTDVPFRDLTAAQRDWVFRGDATFPGVEGFFETLERKRYKMHVRIFIARFRGYVTCPRCEGARLRPEALAHTLAGRTIHQLHALPIDALRDFIAALRLPAVRRRKVRALVESIAERLRCLTDLDVGYLTLERSGRTLSGGETQRIRIAAALGSALTDTLFILDEPTVGLHARDTGRMVAVLRRLARTGNTVVVVEHDPQVIEAADHLIVLGPGGGREGGRLLYEGPPAAFLQESPEFFTSSTGAPPLPPRRRRGRGGQR
ncbi:MAG: excinuclease ABC subunit A, partial [Candidatus Eisenbacteria bacterium]|nr:excinuclease ABC subunit A [Candidatus Eisenbacteria bacterium]